jgi:hypothetical protein
MKIPFIKFNLYLFEITTFLLTIWIIGKLLNFCLINRFYSGIDPSNQIFAKITFNTSFIFEIKSDILINVTSINYLNETIPELNTSYEGYIILNKKYYENDNHPIDNSSLYLNSYNFNDCFLFKDHPSLNSGLSILSDMKNYSSDFWNTMLFIFIAFFFFFLKYNMALMNICAIKNLKKEKYMPLLKIKKYIFSYLILPLSILLSLPLLYNYYDDLKMDHCFGFERNYFNSFFFDRTFLSDRQKEKINIFSHVYKNENFYSSPIRDHNHFRDDFTEKDKFLYHSPYLFKELTNTYSYKYNILFLCTMVWISGLFIRKILEKNEDEQETKKISKIKKILRILYLVILLVSWGFYIFEGALNFIDTFIFYHELIFYNFKKIVDWPIFSFLFFCYLHIYFYVFLTTYTLISYCKIKMRNKNYYEIYDRQRSSNNSNQLNQTKMSAENMSTNPTLNINEISIRTNSNVDNLIQEK